MPIELKLTPRKAALLLGHDNMLEVLVRVIAPESATAEALRKPLNLALVIDKSGSMSGQPLHEAKRCAEAIVARMRPGDFASVIAYDNRIETVAPAQPVRNGDAIKRAIRGIESGGQTALHQGWAAGAEQAAINILAAGTSRVLLLSDGCANHGLTDPALIAGQCGQLAAKGVTTSTYGLGDHFNEQLMLQMAKSGGGNAYYGKTADDLMGPFQQEFDLLLATCARKLRLRLLPAPDVRMTVANDLPEIDGEWRLPDLARGSEVWALVRLRLAAAEVANGLQVPLALLSASLRYEGEAGGGFAETAPLVLPALAAGSFDAVAEDELVARRAQEVRFADYQRDAAAAARQGDWANVDAILVQARDAASGHDWLASSLTSLERYAASRSREEYAKEASFKSHRMMSRPVSPSEAAAFDVRSDAFMPSFLQRRREEGKSGDGQPGAGGAAAPGSEPEPLKPPSLFGRTKRDGGQ